MDEFNVADDLSAYSVEDIDTLITQGNTRLDELFAIDPSAVTDEQVAEAEKIAAAVKDLGAEKHQRATAASQRVERMSALKDSRVEASTDDLAVAEDVQVDDEEKAEEDAEEEAKPEATVETPEKEKAVTASAPAVIVPKPRPVVPETPKPRISITAAGDVPGFSNGQSIEDLDSLTKAFINRTRGWGPTDGSGEGGMQQYNLATIAKPFDDPQLIADRGKGMTDQEVMDYAGDEKRLDGGSLVAAGGWCAPSEYLLDFCTGASTDGLWSVPEMSVTRGGIQTTPGPDFATLYSSSGFSQTEAQAIAGTAKGCYEVPCPSFTETRLDAVGLCIKSPILTEAGWPELVSSTISQALVAQQHRVSGALLTKALTAATANSTINAVGSTASDTLNALELIAETLRNVYRMPLNMSMELVLPYWVRAAIRADLANRTGEDFFAVTDQMINQWFAIRKLAPQWVYNFGTALALGEEGYPANFTALMYPAGTFVKGTSPVINLNAVYDAASLDVNMYTALFAEEGVLLAKRCFQARKVVIPLNQAGKTGVASNTATFTLT